MYRSQQNGSLTGTWTKSTQQPINQFYTVAVSRQDISRITDGAQDIGSLRYWGTPSWNAIGGGDGTTNLIDPTNQAASWTVISPDLSRGIPGIGGAPFGTITAVAVARTDGRVIYAGTDDGRVWITKNTGGTWTEITAGLPTRWITRLAVDPGNALVAYVMVSGYRSGDPKAHVFRTTNGGAAWQDISANLPDAPVNDIVLDPRNAAVLYVATDVGVFTSTVGTGQWSPVGTGLPAVPVADLEATPGATTLLTAATYGLGMYRIAVP